MHKFKEEILQHIWKCRHISPGALKTVSGKPLEVLFPGELNVDSGPDFSSAQVVIDGLHLAGNIEVHVRTSDWLRHKHQFDLAYDKIILHVVFDHDISLPQNENNGVEVLELKNKIPPNTLSLYEQFFKPQKNIPCSRQLPYLDDAVFVSWLEQLALTRLENKVARVQEVFEECRGDYSQTFFLVFLRSFGFKINAVPFELLGKNVTLNLLLRHSDKLQQLEALLLGSAGFLSDQFESPYLRTLQNEFSFLQRKYALVTLDHTLFKFSRLRPSNFPTLRLLQLARLIHRVPQIFSAPQLFMGSSELRQIIKGHLKSTTLSADQYSEINAAGSNIGSCSIEGIMINAFAPFHFFYGHKLNQFRYKSAALLMIKSCAPESNFKTRHFQQKKHVHTSAFISQGMIQLYDHYCDPKKCLHCEVGNYLLSA